MLLLSVSSSLALFGTATVALVSRNGAFSSHFYPLQHEMQHVVCDEVGFELQSSEKITDIIRARAIIAPPWR